MLAYDGSAMRQVNAAEILDIAMAGTSATLLAKRWESALLVNVDNDTLRRLMANQAAMDALMRIEGFRSLNENIETIINKSEAVKKAKKSADKLPPDKKKELSEEEKEYKSKRKEIQEKLIKFATRVPVFMYLTDFREFSLRDVITQLEPALFRKVTGLDVKDFELLVSLNVFNESLMNDAVYKFKRYEDSSLAYAGIDRHAGEDVGLYSTVLRRQDYEEMAGRLTRSMEAPAVSAANLPDTPYPAYTADDDDEEEEPPQPRGKKNDGHRVRPDALTPPELLHPHTPANEPDAAAAPRNKTAVPAAGAAHAGTIRRTAAAAGRPAGSPGAAGAAGLHGGGLTARPEKAAPAKAAPPDIDVSGVKPGTAVSHKAFGTGKVKSLDGGRITVDFAGEEKVFQFPGAFYQGFLKLIG